MPSAKDKWLLRPWGQIWTRRFFWTLIALNLTLSGNLTNADDHAAPNQARAVCLPSGMYSKASLSGRVRDARLPNLEIELRPIRYSSSLSDGYAVRPDKDGRFSFDGVDPGMYVLLARGPGYIPVAYGAKGPLLEGTPITLLSGEHRKHINLTAAPGRLICGKVTREDGQPVGYQPLWITTALARSGSPSAMWADGKLQIFAPPKTDADGNFRFRVLRPGPYFIGINTGHGPDPDSVRIYWRSSWNLADALPLNNPGRATGEKCQDDIRLPRQVPTGHHVRGRLTGPAGSSPKERFSVGLVPINSAGAQGWGGGGQVIPINSDFDIPGTHPGMYLIEVYRVPAVDQKNVEVTSATPPILAGPNPALATKRITVGDRDVSGVNLDVPPEASVSVKLEFENINLEEKRRWIAIGASDFLTLSDVVHPGTLVGKEGPADTFNFSDLYHSDFSVRVLLYGPLFVKSMRLNGRPVHGQTFTLLPGQAGKLEIVISDNSAEVDVTVKPEQPRVLFSQSEECRLTVPPSPRVAFLIPDPVPEDASGLIGGYEGTDGVRCVHGVPPGRYRVLAMDNYNWLWAPSDPDLAKRRARLMKIANLGVPIEVHAGEKLAVTVSDSTSVMQRVRAEQGEAISIRELCPMVCGPQDFWFRSDLTTSDSKTKSNASH